MPRSTGVKAKVERAAIELFAARGVDGVSIGDIAAAAGVSQGALYRHYASKEELAWSLFSTAYLRMGGELDAIRAAAPRFRSRLAAMVAHFCALYDDDPALFRFMLLAQHGLLPRVPADGAPRSMRSPTPSRMRARRANSPRPRSIPSRPRP